jgi:hypothetical protein
MCQILLEVLESRINFRINSAYIVKFPLCKMLLGVTTNQNNLWPYPKQYEQSSKYNGEWTEVNEVWFKRQADAIHYARKGCLCSGRANIICPYTTDKYCSETTSGTAAHARACCTHLMRKWPGLWNDFSFTYFV